MPPDTDRQPRPLRADAERNRQRILDAAARGVRRARPRRHARRHRRRAPASGSGTVYRRFPDKDDADRRAVRGQDRRRSRGSRATRCAIEDPWEAFETFMRGVCRAARRATAASRRPCSRATAAASACARRATRSRRSPTQAPAARPGRGRRPRRPRPVRRADDALRGRLHRRAHARDSLPTYWERLLTSCSTASRPSGAGRRRCRRARWRSRTCRPRWRAAAVRRSPAALRPGRRPAPRTSGRTRPRAAACHRRGGAGARRRRRGAPVRQQPQRPAELAAGLRELVDEARRALRVRALDHERVPGQPLQPRREECSVRCRRAPPGVR